MRYSHFIYNSQVITDPNEQNRILEANNFHWLIDSEVESCKIEIKNNTLIWHDGVYYSGHWHYGIFKSGEFYGVFENGIFEGGKFHGKFISGVNLVEV